jgi:hypothetical protein
MKHTLSWGALVGALLLAVVPVTSATAATSITADTGGWVLAGQTAGFSVALAGTTGEDLIVTIELADGTMSVDDSGLALTLQPGSLSFTDVSELSFTGSSTDVTAALAERLTWTAPLTPAQSYLRLSISVGSFYAGLVTDAVSGHHYLQSVEALSWSNARDAAAALTYNGLTGYLVTITSGEENTFVTTQAGGATVYIAATSEIEYVNPLLAPENRYANEFDARGRYHWGSGPEAGVQLTWAPWFPDEPNNLAGERCLLTNWNGATGLWNDGNCASLYRYVVEFGGIGTETGPAEFDNLDAQAPPLAEPELADTGAELMPALTVGLLALLVGFGMLTARRAWRAAPRPGA